MTEKAAKKLIEAARKKETIVQVVSGEKVRLSPVLGREEGTVDLPGYVTAYPLEAVARDPDWQTGEELLEIKARKKQAKTSIRLDFAGEKLK